jgi:hypothetical protein
MGEEHSMFTNKQMVLVTLVLFVVGIFLGKTYPMYSEKQKVQSMHSICMNWTECESGMCANGICLPLASNENTFNMTASTGTSVVTITGTANGRSHTATVRVNATAPVVGENDFAILLSNTSLTFTQSDKAVQEVGVQLIAKGNPMNVSVTVLGAPQGMIVILSMQQSRSDGAFSFAVRPGDALPGSYTMFVKGFNHDNGVEHVVPFTVIVNPTKKP